MCIYTYTYTYTYTYPLSISMYEQSFIPFRMDAPRIRPGRQVMRGRGVRCSVEAMDAALGACDPWRMENHGKIMGKSGKSWENQGKSWENNGTSWENHGNNIEYSMMGIGWDILGCMGI